MSGLSLQESNLSSGWVSIAVEGEVDLATVAQLEKAMSAAFEKGGPLVVDLNDTSFMDSTGLKALVAASRRYEADQRGFAISVGGGPVSRLISLSGVDSSIRTVDDPDELEAATSH